MQSTKKWVDTEIEVEPFIPYVGEEQFTAELKALLAPYKDRMGFLPNALRLHAWRPEIARTLWELNDNVMRDPSSTLDVFLKRRLAAVASAVNGCSYCTAHSCSMLKRSQEIGAEGWGLNDDEVGALVEGSLEPSNEMERVCFDFVRAASLDAPNMPDEIFPRLRQRLTPAQIVELAMLVGFWKFYNTVHDSLRIPVEKFLAADAKYAQTA